MCVRNVWKCVCERRRSYHTAQQAAAADFSFAIMYDVVVFYVLTCCVWHLISFGGIDKKEEEPHTQQPRSSDRR